MAEWQSVWGLPIAVYLFLGGLAAGTFIAAAVLRFLGGDRWDRVVARSALASAVFLALGIFALLVDVEKPAQALNLFSSFSHGQSWMAIGAWILTAAFIVFVAYAVLASRGVGNSTLGMALGVVGSVLSLGVAVYSGVLLAVSPAVPFWQTWLVPALFTLSALTTGFTLVALLAAFEARRGEGGETTGAGASAAMADADAGAKAPAGSDEAASATAAVAAAATDEKAVNGVKPLATVNTIVLVCTVVEALCLAALIVSAQGAGGARATSASLATTDVLGGLFWTFVVVLGLAVPLVLVGFHALGKGRRSNALALSAVGGACALVGGFFLRYVVLAAGVHATVIAPVAFQAMQAAPMLF